MNIANIKYKIRVDKNKGESTCAKLFQMPLEEQYERISEIMSNRGKCFNCDDTYLVVDTSVCEDNPSHKRTICLCTNCNDMVDVIFERRTLRIVRVEDSHFIENKENI